MLKSEEDIKEMYRAYIELWACKQTKDQREKDILHGAVLAYGRVLGFNAVKVYKDMEMAKNKYLIL